MMITDSLARPKAMGNVGHETKRILVVQCCVGIGDMVMHLPYIHSLAKRAPSSQVSILTKKRSLAHDLFSGNPLIDRVFFVKQRSTLSALLMASQLRGRGFCEVWILHRSFSVSLACWLAGIPKRYGYGIGAQRFLLTDHPRHMIVPPQSTADHTSLPRQLLSAYGVPIESGSERIPISPINQAVVTSFLEGKPQPLIALGIGASVPNRRWAPAHFATLIHRLCHQQVEGHFLLCGSKDDGVTCQAILGLLTPEVQKRVTPVFHMTIQQMAGLLAACRLIIGNDSSLINIAAAMGTPALGLFGVNPPLVHSPHIMSVVPHKGVHPHGMDEISPDMVVQKTISFLQK